MWRTQTSNVIKVLKTGTHGYENRYCNEFHSFGDYGVAAIGLVSTVQYSTVQYSTVQYITANRSTIRLTRLIRIAGLGETPKVTLFRNSRSATLAVHSVAFNLLRGEAWPYWKGAPHLASATRDFVSGPFVAW